MEVALKVFVNRIENMDARLKEGKAIFKIFTSIFDQCLISASKSFSDKEKIYFKSYLGTRLQKELRITKRLASISSNTDSSKNIFEACFEQFFQTATDPKFELIENNSILHLFENEWDKALLEVVQTLSSTQEDSDKVFDYLYKRYGELSYVKRRLEMVESKLKRTHRNEKHTSANEVFNDAFEGFMENIIWCKFKGESMLSTYFISIFNNKFSDFYRNATATNDPQAGPVEKKKEKAIDPGELEQFFVSKKGSHDSDVAEVFLLLDKGCQKIIHFYIVLNQPMVAIAQQFNISVYQAERMLENCIDKLKKYYFNLI